MKKQFGDVPRGKVQEIGVWFLCGMPCGSFAAGWTWAQGLSGINMAEKEERQSYEEEERVEESIL